MLGTHGQEHLKEHLISAVTLKMALLHQQLEIILFIQLMKCIILPIFSVYRTKMIGFKLDEETKKGEEAKDEFKETEDVVPQ